jgi:hypothetical protein
MITQPCNSESDCAAGDPLCVYVGVVVHSESEEWGWKTRWGGSPTDLLTAEVALGSGCSATRPPPPTSRASEVASINTGVSGDDHPFIKRERAERVPAKMFVGTTQHVFVTNTNTTG